MDISELYSIFCKHPVVTTDTRDCPEGSIFFALKGTTFDGNKFAADALKKGCAYAVVDEKEALTAGDDRFILVDDVLETLQQLAKYHRQKLGTKVIQITGTNGKTTTKELVAAVLSEKFNVLFTQGNFNNHIGVPKTLLRLKPCHDIAVIETGASHPGEIKMLSNIVDPDCGLITNVGRAHLAGFGSFEGVIKTKGELYDYLRGKEGSFIFIDGNNEHLNKISAGLKRIAYGLPGNGFDIEGEVADCSPYLKVRWRRNGGEWHEVQTHLIGSYNLQNVLAAAAVGNRFGVGEEQICQALQNYKPTNNRSEFKKTKHNELIIDAYNANPTSMKAALENFARISHPHKMAILGEMCELGDASAEEHKNIVNMLGSTGCETVWLVGEEFKAFAGQYAYFDNVEQVEEQLKKDNMKDCLILIKGSNATKLFKLPEYL